MSPYGSGTIDVGIEIYRAKEPICAATLKGALRKDVDIPKAIEELSKNGMIDYDSQSGVCKISKNYESYFKHLSDSVEKFDRTVALNNQKRDMRMQCQKLGMSYGSSPSLEVLIETFSGLLPRDRRHRK